MEPYDVVNLSVSALAFSWTIGLLIYALSSHSALHHDKAVH